MPLLLCGFSTWNRKDVAVRERRVCGKITRLWGVCNTWSALLFGIINRNYFCTTFRAFFCSPNLAQQNKPSPTRTQQINNIPPAGKRIFQMFPDRWALCTRVFDNEICLCCRSLSKPLAGRRRKPRRRSNDRNLLQVLFHRVNSASAEASRATRFAT